VELLYEAGRDERDACGIGFVADAAGRSSRAVVEAALEALFGGPAAA
jgi:glutamate synthase domain-containing protein 1